MPDAISAINEHSCALACISYLLSVYKTPTSQDDLIKKYRSKFPAWDASPGLLSRGGLVDILWLEGIPFRRFLHTPSWKEAKEELAKRKPRAAFIYRRKPTNHCYFLMGEDPSGKILLMMPDRPKAQIATCDPDLLSKESDCDFLLFFE